MTTKNGDLPASPISYDARMMAAYSKGEAMGLTKREYFAALAMQACRSRNSNYASWSDLATDAVEIADALLAKLENSK